MCEILGQGGKEDRIMWERYEKEGLETYRRSKPSSRSLLVLKGGRREIRDTRLDCVSCGGGVIERDTLF